MTRTDPNATVTYAITRRHQQQIVEELQGTAHPVKLGHNLGVLTGERSLAEVELTDRTDDFDFIWQPGDELVDRVVFRYYNKGYSTSAWSPNDEEAAAGTDTWDVDTDDDGLTDGQEAHGVIDFGLDANEPVIGHY